jgi:arylsulfatase
MVYSFDNAGAAEQHTTQYFEMFGNRGIYHNGWVACTRHSIPWVLTQNPPLENDVWELYNVAEDFSEAHNLAGHNAAKLEELKKVFDDEAIKNHVYPIDDRRSERFNPETAGRPDLIGHRTSLTLYSGMTGIMENAFINVKNKSHTITAEVEVKAGANGVIISQAGRFGGWSMYTKGGRACFEYNYGGLQRSNIRSAAALSPGTHVVKYSFTPNSPKPGDGGKAVLYVDDKQVGEMSVARTMPFIYSADEGVDVGMDMETSVSNDYLEGDNAFNGKIHKITVALTK